VRQIERINAITRETNKPETPCAIQALKKHSYMKSTFFFGLLQNNPEKP
jgi:hypothetical protein